jgi:hypothetical protein
MAQTTRKLAHGCGKSPIYKASSLKDVNPATNYQPPAVNPKEETKDI